MAALSDVLQQFYSIFSEQVLFVEQAAYLTFGIDSAPPRLRRILDNWASGDFVSINSLPSIRLIDQDAISASWAGAYSDQTNTIYLNRSWIEQSTAEQLLYVIIHEVGHFLDREYWDDLGGGDTPGEEGHQFAVKLYGLLDRELPTGFLIAEQASPVVANIVEGLAYVDMPSSPIEAPRFIQVGPDGSYYSIMRTYSGTGEVLDAEGVPYVNDDGSPYVAPINETHHLVSIRQDGSIDGTFSISIPGRMVIGQYSDSFMLANGDAILLMSDMSAYKIPTAGPERGQIDQSFSSQFIGSLDAIRNRILLPEEQMTINEYTASDSRMLLSIFTQDPNYLSRTYIVGILSDGSLDTSFGDQGVVNTAHFIGRLTQLGSGVYSMGDDAISFAPVKYSLSGVLQPSAISSPFGPQYFSDVPGEDYFASTTGITELQGKLYTYGTLNIRTTVFGYDPSGSVNSVDYVYRLAGFVIRWNADLTPDISFGRNGLFVTPQALGQERALKLFSPDPGSLTLVVENSERPSPDQPYDLPSTVGYYYITSSGNLDILKGASGFVAARTESDVSQNNDDHVAAMDAQGRLLIGSMTNPGSKRTGTPPMDGLFYRLLPDGSADPTFGPEVRVAVELSEVLTLSTIPVDTTPPTIASIAVEGTTITLTFSEAVSALGVLPSAFTVATVNSRNQATNRTVRAVTQDQNDPTKLILTLEGTAPASNVNLRISYTDPAGDTSTGDVQDLAGNDLAPLTDIFADTFITSSTTTLASKYQNLTLTGNLSRNGTGNALANTITGNGANNTLSGLAGDDTLLGEAGNDILIGGTGGDVLTGGAGTDTFRLALSDSLLSNYDKITDFVIGTDRLDGPNSVSARNLKELGPVQELTQEGIAAVLTDKTFVRNGAATFTWQDGATLRTFVALNNGTAGFSSATDAIIEILGQPGDLANLAVV